jgi:hypothetical protein
MGKNNEQKENPMYNYTVQLNASDALVEFDGDRAEAHETARQMSGFASPLQMPLGYSVIDPNGRIEAIYRAGLRWKFRETDGRWIELSLFDTEVK